MAEKASPAAIQNYLKGADYPASKQDLIELAQDNDAPQDVMNIINKLPDRDYGSPADVNTEVGNVE